MSRNNVLYNKDLWYKMYTKSKEGRSYTCMGKPMDWKKRTYFPKNNDLKYIEIEYYNSKNKSAVKFRQPRQFEVHMEVNSSFLYGVPTNAHIISSSVKLMGAMTTEKFEDYMMNYILDM